MAKITDIQIAASYDLGKKFVGQEITYGVALGELVDFYGMNRNSAGMYLNNISYLRNGQVFKRTMSLPAAQYFLRLIYRDFGPPGLKNALTSFQLHIDYWTNLTGQTPVGLMKVVASFTDALPTALVRTEEQVTAFAESLDRSARLEPDERRELAGSGNAKPKIRLVIARTYERNPHVVVEVLLRANGDCESCNSRAPFIRQSNGSPYLEVHHRIPLAEGGYDTIENAIALCPNCHREAHFGRDWAKFRPNSGE